MKYLFVLLLVLSNIISVKAQTISADQILGNWISPDNDLIVNCYKVNDQYFGKIVWFKKYNDDKHGVNTAVPESQWLNMVVMKHFVFKDNQWKDGEIYNLNSGKTYDSYIEMSDANSLKLTGYIWFTFFGESIQFKKYTQAKLPEFK